MQLEKLFYKYKFKIKRIILGEKTQHVSSNRVTIRHNHVLHKESDLSAIYSSLNKLGIQTDNKSIREIERAIDEKIMESISVTVLSFPDDAKVKGMGDKFLESLDNRNLLMLKHHLITLKAWLESE